jgi:MOSC domain-containing protein YiiM
LPKDTRLHIGGSVVLRITGLRNPCPQIEAFQKGLLSQMVERTDDGSLILKTGIMSVVEASGEIVVGDQIRIQLPSLPHVVLERV